MIASVVGIGIGFIIGLSIGFFYFQGVKDSDNIKPCPAVRITPNFDQDFDLIMEDLTPGDRSIYERKITIAAEFPQGNKWEIFGWGDAKVPVFGCINSIPENTAKLENRMVTIQANQNDQTIFERSVKTDKYGNFNSSFFAPENGIIFVSAEIANLNSTIAGETVSVVVTEAWGPIIIILILIVIAIAIIVGFMLKFKNKVPKWSIIPVLIPVVFAYAFLYKFPPFDDAANAAFATALIIPIATYMYGVLIKTKPTNDTNQQVLTTQRRP